MDFIFSLAHFCEVHGPTSILCTQAIPQPCQSCQFSVASSFSSSSDHSSKDSWPLPPLHTDTMHSESTTTDSDPILSSPLDTPPSSPPCLDDSFNPFFSKENPPHEPPTTFGGGIDIDSDACNSCSFVVPDHLNQQLPDNASGISRTDGKVKNGSPVLRTRGSVCSPDPPFSTEIKASTSLGTNRSWDIPKPSRAVSIRHADSTGSTASTASSYSSPAKSHTHILTYLTTRHPQSPAAYSLLRRSCIRTLSCENLPRGSPSGPILFGDPVAGYTIAFIFRLPDSRARGRRRTYALIALGGRDCWRASAAMVEITRVFSSIASWIIGMAEQTLEAEFKAQTQASPTPDDDKGPRSAGITPVSSFLLAKKVDPDGYSRIMSKDTRGAKGLVEIVGRDSVFVELHVQFVTLLAHLSRQFSV